MCPLNYSNQLSNCSPVSSGNISASPGCCTNPVQGRQSQQHLFHLDLFPHPPLSEPLVRCPWICCREGGRWGHLGRVFGGGRALRGLCWLHQSWQESLRAWCVPEINVTIAGLEENGFRQPGEPEEGAGLGTESSC